MFRVIPRRPLRLRPLRSLAVLAGLAALSPVSGDAVAQAVPTLPEIRLSAANPVPRCVTPERLMAFLKRRNGNLIPRFRDIAHHYKRHGEAWQVRWDYAFFQMALETNFLTYRAPSGRMGDVDPKQNNFAGIGTTGGGVPGDSFPDVSTGVLGQIQHLVVYSGETVAEPVASRTRLKQEHILAKSRELNRPVRFSDLARRWAADPKYASSMRWVAEQFNREECKGRQPPPQETEVLPWQQPKREAAKKPVRAAADASSPVRTVWRRDEKKTAQPAAPKAAVPPPVKAAAAPAQPQPDAIARKLVEAPPPARRDIVLGATAVEEPAATAAEETTGGFALFTPPAALAQVVIPPAAPAPARIAAVPMAAAPAPEMARGAPPVMGPPAPPGGAEVAPLAAAAPAIETAEAPKPSFLPPSGLGVKPGRCVVETATFGGDTTVLVKAPVGADTHYIALSVLDGFEDSMTKSFLASRPGGAPLGTFASKEAALAQARTLCPE